MSNKYIDFQNALIIAYASAMAKEDTDNHVYGMKINGGTSSPYYNVKYLRDSIGMEPCYMDYDSGEFNWGSWRGAFFMPRPCMLKYDGTVDYYLNESDYTSRMDGSASDISNLDYEGNAMMEWGRNGKKIWWKIVPIGDGTSCEFYVADYQADSDFNCWNHHNCNSEVVDHFYTPIYNGSLDTAGRLRSISGLKPMVSKTAQQEIDAAKLNNQTDSIEWYTEVYVDVLLINMLLIMMGKSTNTQTVYGYGNLSGSGESYLINSGSMNQKGLFFGNNTTDKTGVKVFGMENWWANQWRRYGGHINDNGTQKCKLTYGTEDGTTATGYNLDGNGYLNIGATPSGTSGRYVQTALFTEKGMFTYYAPNSSGQEIYFCDGLWFSNSQIDYALRGGNCGSGLLCGALYVNLHTLASRADWSIGAALSCKPLGS